MNAQQIYELVKGWVDRWPAGMKWIAGTWVNANLMVVEGRYSVIPDSVAERAFTDRACELARCGVVETKNPHCFVVLEANRTWNVTASSRLEAACIAMKCRQARDARKEEPDELKCPVCGTIMVRHGASSQAAKCVNCGFDALKKGGGA